MDCQYAKQDHQNDQKLDHPAQSSRSRLLQTKRLPTEFDEAILWRQLRERQQFEQRECDRG